MVVSCVEKVSENELLIVTQFCFCVFAVRSESLEGNPRPCCSM